MARARLKRFVDLSRWAYWTGVVPQRTQVVPSCCSMYARTLARRFARSSALVGRGFCCLVGRGGSLHCLLQYARPLRLDVKVRPHRQHVGKWTGQVGHVLRLRPNARPGSRMPQGWPHVRCGPYVGR